ncbi:MAG TPA: hypothetical protein VFS37_03360 [Conexibacter sp.]|nr:hypothetical protein [Conexibacter sp.]
MLAKLRARLTYANVGVTIALVLGTTGFAVAATRRPATRTVTACVTRADGSVRIVSARARCGRRARRLAWAKAGPRGLTGAQGPQGQQGPAGPLLDTLPRGRTLRGVYDASGTVVNGQTIQTTEGTSVTFQLPLASAPAAHFLPKLARPTAECPGSVDRPEAAPGHLCVYEGGQWSNGPITIYDPTTQASPGAAKWGFGLLIQPMSNTGTYGYTSHGTWAVTAP